MYETADAVRDAAAAALTESAPLRPALEAIVAATAPSLMEESVLAGTFGGDTFPAALADALDMLEDESLAFWVETVL